MTSYPSGLWSMRPIIPDKFAKFHDPWLNRSREIPPDTVGGGIFNNCFAITSDEKKVMMSYPVRL